MSWSLEEVARKTFQNFFDANNFTLDKVNINMVPRAEGSYTVRIYGPAEYDYHKLLDIGGTSKNGSYVTAGEFGDGAKIAALILLRDFGFSRVVHGSGDRELEFYIGTVPKGSNGEKKTKGLWAKVRLKKANLVSRILSRILSKYIIEKNQGSYVELTTTDQGRAKLFLDAKQLFYYTAHPDFQNPAYKGEKYWFVYIGQGQKGHLYDAGQRRHYKEEKVWAVVEGMHIGTKDIKAFSADKGSVTRKQLEEQVLKPMAEGMSQREMIAAIMAMEPAWSRGHYDDADKTVLRLMVNRLSENNPKL